MNWVGNIGMVVHNLETLGLGDILSHDVHNRILEKLDEEKPKAQAFVETHDFPVEELALQIAGYRAYIRERDTLLFKLLKHLDQLHQKHGNLDV